MPTAEGQAAAATANATDREENAPSTSCCRHWTSQATESRTEALELYTNPPKHDQSKIDSHKILTVGTLKRGDLPAKRSSQKAHDLPVQFIGTDEP
jgi:hypothetical protein